MCVRKLCQERVEDPAVSVQLLKPLLWRSRFHPWLGNVHVSWVSQKTNKQTNKPGTKKQLFQSFVLALLWCQS